MDFSFLYLQSRYDGSYRQWSVDVDKFKFNVIQFLSQGVNVNGKKFTSSRCALITDDITRCVSCKSSDVFPDNLSS